MIDKQSLISGQRRALSKAITLVESRLDSHQDEAQRLLHSVLPHTGNALRVGISGPPGVGKSTFIDALGCHITFQGQSVAALTIDPSSPVGGGSVLGDKTRMQRLAREPNAYVRPSPSRGHIGGVARQTGESMLLCEAAGFEVILVESVGVGQSEVDLATIVDTFLVLLQPNTGDELQGIKKGIIELADLLVVNKADGKNIAAAESAAQSYKAAVGLLRSAKSAHPPVLTCSSIENRGIDQIWSEIAALNSQDTQPAVARRRRAAQRVSWMRKLFQEMLEDSLQSNQQFSQLKSQLERQVADGTSTPSGAAKELIQWFKNSLKDYHT